MKFGELLAVVGDEPVFETGLLAAGTAELGEAQRQLSRWVASGKVYQLRRGLYALAPPYQRVRPHPFVVANRLVRGSYVSLQSALAYHGLIPEHVPVTTSITTGRPGRWETPLGVYEFHHIQRDLFTGYRRQGVLPGQEAFVAVATKALLDLVHLVPGGDGRRYLEQLRLSGLEDLDTAWARQSAIAERPKLQRALRELEALASADA